MHAVPGTGIPAMRDTFKVRSLAEVPPVPAHARGAIDLRGVARRRARFVPLPDLARLPGLDAPDDVLRADASAADAAAAAFPTHILSA